MEKNQYIIALLLSTHTSLRNGSAIPLPHIHREYTFCTECLVICTAYGRYNIACTESIVDAVTVRLTCSKLAINRWGQGGRYKLYCILLCMHQQSNLAQTVSI